VRVALAVERVGVGVGHGPLDVGAAHGDVGEQGGGQDAGVEVKVEVVVAVERVVGDPGVSRGGGGDDEVERGGEVGAERDGEQVAGRACA